MIEIKIEGLKRGIAALASRLAVRYRRAVRKTPVDADAEPLTRADKTLMRMMGETVDQ